MGNNLTRTGRPEEAITYFKKSLELNPQFQRAHMYLGRNYLLLGKTEMALKEMQQENLEVFRIFGLALAYHALGRSKEADEALKDFAYRYQNEWNYLLAELHAYQGEKDKGEIDVTCCCNTTFKSAASNFLVKLPSASMRFLLPGPVYHLVFPIGRSMTRS